MNARVCLLSLALGALASCRSAPGPALAPLGPAPAVDSGAAGRRVNGAIAPQAPAGAPFVARAEALPPTPAAPAPATKADLTFSFVDADLRDILRGLLGETLQLNYVVDSDVQGSGTLATTVPVDRAQALAMLEGVLATNNAVLVKEGPLYRVRSSSSASAAPVAAEASSTGIVTLPLHSISANQVVKILTPFVSPDTGLVADAGRNIVLLSGSPSARATLSALVETLDSDLLSGQSLALFPAADGTAAALAAVLEKALQTQEGGALAGVVRIVPLEQVSAVLLVAHEAATLDQARRLLDAVDRAKLLTMRSWHVYFVRNGPSIDLASVARQAMPPSGDPAKGGMRVVADKTRNALAIYATAEEYARLQATLDRLDQIPVQVRIDVSVAEVTLGDNLSYGVQFALRNAGLGALLTNGSGPAISTTTPSFALAHNGSSGPQEVLSTLADVTQLRLVSEPQITVAANTRGSIEVGDQVPYVSGSSTATLFADAPTVNSINYVQTGVKLEVTPRVSDGGLVGIDLAEQVSAPEANSASTIGSPAFSDRQFSSRVAMQDGQTVAVAGIIRDTQSVGNSGIPGLKDVPGLGSAGSTETIGRSRTELVVLITPHVIRDQRDARALTEDLRQALRPSAAVPDALKALAPNGSADPNRR